MKKAKKIIEEDGHVFDSSEELHMYWYFKELQEKGIVWQFQVHPGTIDLLPPVKREYIKKMKRVPDKIVTETIMQGQSYTSDFIVHWNDIPETLLFCSDIDSKIKKNDKQFSVVKLGSVSDLSKPITKDSFEDFEYYCYVEVKPVFDQNNMTRLVRNTIKLAYYIHGYVVNIAVPEKVFNKTFTPKRFLFTNISKQRRKIKYKNVITLEEFLKKP